MENLDATIIATGLPSMARDFHVSPVNMSLGITSYLLTLAIFIPASGWMASRFGERRMFTSAIAIFTIASVACGLSHSLPAFTMARVLQGLGGAMMVPVGRLMVIRAARKEQLMRAIAYTTWPALVAPILGPPVGGYILSIAHWPWMFLVNVPIGIVLFVAALKLVQDGAPHSRERFDMKGFLLVASTSALLMYLVEDLQRERLSVMRVVAILVVFCGMVALTYRHLTTAKLPLFQLEAFRIESFRVSMGGGSLNRMAVLAVPFLLPLLFQTSFGLNPLQSGTLTMAVFCGNLAMKPLTSPLLRRFGFRKVLLVNGACTAASLAACGWLRADMSQVVVLLVLFAGGLGRSMQMTSMTTLGLSELPPNLTTMGATLSTTIQQMGTSLGIALAALVLNGSAALHGGAMTPGDFRNAFSFTAVLMLCGLPAFFWMHPDAGAQVSGALLQRGQQEVTAEG